MSKRDMAAATVVKVVGVETKTLRPPLHIGIYGEPQVGKSHFVATTIAAIQRDSGLPGYVAFFDRQGKHLTYEKVWRHTYEAPLDITEGTDKRGTPWKQYHAKGQVIARVGFYAQAAVRETDGVGRLMEYFPHLEAEIAAGKWGTFALDSVSFLAYDARKQSQYVDNPNTKMPMQWYAQSTDMVEEVLCSLVPNLTCNTNVVMHESKVTVEAEGTMVRSPAVPGKRLASTNMIAATFPELYRLYVERGDDGKRRRRLQTESDEFFQAGSVIGAPDGCKPTYEALWSGWEIH